MNQEYENKVDAKIESRMRRVENLLMQSIVKTVRKAGKITSSADWQLTRMAALGDTAEEIRSILEAAAEGTDVTVDELYQMALDSDYTRNRAIYEAEGKEYTPYDQNYEYQQIISGLKAQTSEELDNITRTEQCGFSVVKNGQRVFMPMPEFVNDYLDQALTEITTGATSYNDSLKRVVFDMTSSGLRTIDYASGRSNRVDVAARRAVLTGLSQFTGKITMENARKLNTKYYEVEWHAGARVTGTKDYLDHQWWQGKVYSEDDLREKCGYGTGGGLMGWNCYHSFYPFFPGISERNYTDEWLAEQNAKENTPVQYGGKEYTYYEATQRQRQLETQMRAYRERIQLLRDGEADEDLLTLTQCKYQDLLNEYKAFSGTMGLPLQLERVSTGVTTGRFAPTSKEYALYKAQQEAKKSVQKDISYNGVPEEIMRKMRSRNNELQSDEEDALNEIAKLQKTIDKGKSELSFPEYADKSKKELQELLADFSKKELEYNEIIKSGDFNRIIEALNGVNTIQKDIWKLRTALEDMEVDEAEGKLQKAEERLLAVQKEKLQNEQNFKNVAFEHERSILSGIKRIAAENIGIDDGVENTNLRNYNAVTDTDEEYRYHRNCQRCVWAYELRRRGYDVEALPKISEDGDEYSAGKFRKVAALLTGDELLPIEGIRNKNKTEFVYDIQDKMLALGDGARAIVQCTWEYDGGGHLFIAEVSDGRVRYIDPQDGTADAKDYFNLISYKDDDLALLRIDDVPVNDLIFDCVREKND